MCFVCSSVGMTEEIARILILRENELFLSQCWSRPSWAISDWERYEEHNDCLKINFTRMTSCFSANDVIDGFVRFRFDDFLAKFAPWGLYQHYLDYFTEKTRTARGSYWHLHVDRLGFPHRVFVGRGASGRLILPIWAKGDWREKSIQRARLAEQAALSSNWILPVDPDPRLATRASAEEGGGSVFTVEQIPYSPAPAFASWKPLERLFYDMEEVPLSALNWEISTLCARKIIEKFPYRMIDAEWEKVFLFFNLSSVFVFCHCAFDICRKNCSTQSRSTKRLRAPIQLGCDS